MPGHTATTQSARSQAKVRQILDAARDVFLASGFSAASMEEITRRAGVSKGTLYNYFPTKEALFTTVIQAEMQRHADTLVPEDALKDRCAEAALRRIAKDTVSFLLSDFAQNMYRITVAESVRFPEAAQAFYHAGPGRSAALLAPVLEASEREGLIAVDDHRAAANDFMALCRGDLFFRRMLHVQTDFDSAEIEAAADHAVDQFLRANRP